VRLKNIHLANALKKLESTISHKEQLAGAASGVLFAASCLAQCCHRSVACWFLTSSRGRFFTPFTHMQRPAQSWIPPVDSPPPPTQTILKTNATC
jgi:hypothetical protein